jgi:hypothetical protein
MGNPRVVYQNVDPIPLEDVPEYSFHILLVRDVTTIGSSIASLPNDLSSNGFSSVLINIQDANAGSAGSKSFGDGPADSTSASGNDGNFAVETK